MTALRRHSTFARTSEPFAGSVPPTNRPRQAAGGAALIPIVLAGLAPRAFYRYFLPSVFPLPILAGVGCGMLGERRDALSLRRQAVAIGALPYALGCGTPSLCCATPTWAAKVSDYARFEWTPAQLPGRINNVIRERLWQTGTWPAKHHPNAVTEYLWRESMWLDTHPAIVAKVRESAAGVGGASLLGDYAVAPLVALDARIRLTADIVDLTMQRFDAGTASYAEIERLLLNERSSSSPVDPAIK